MNRFRIAITGLLFILATSGVSADGRNYGPPIDLPEAAVAADPSVIRVNDRYYLYPTTTNRAVECWSSADLDSWTYEGVVWSAGEPGSWNDDIIWAPDVLAYRGSFYLYYSANQMIGVAVADAPTGPFEDVYDHPLIGGGFGGAENQSIDAHVYLDQDGSLYLYCAWHNPISYIRVTRLIDPATVTGQWELVVEPQLNWEFLWVEGPWIVRNGPVYYLMYSGSGAHFPFYAIGYAASLDPMGPFTKHPDNPILKADWDFEFWGPGHNSVVEDEAGNLWIFYHTKIRPQQGWDRVLRKNALAFEPDGRMYVVLDDDDSTDDDIVDDDSDDDADDDNNDNADDADSGCNGC